MNCMMSSVEAEKRHYDDGGHVKWTLQLHIYLCIIKKNVMEYVFPNFRLDENEGNFPFQWGKYCTFRLHFQCAYIANIKAHFGYSNNSV